MMKQCCQRRQHVETSSVSATNALRLVEVKNQNLKKEQIQTETLFESRTTVRETHHRGRN